MRLGFLPYLPFLSLLPFTERWRVSFPLSMASESLMGVYSINSGGGWLFSYVYPSLMVATLTTFAAQT